MTYSSQRISRIRLELRKWIAFINYFNISPLRCFLLLILVLIKILLLNEWSKFPNELIKHNILFKSIHKLIDAEIKIKCCRGSIYYKLISYLIFIQRYMNLHYSQYYMNNFYFRKLLLVNIRYFHCLYLFIINIRLATSQKRSAGAQSSKLNNHFIKSKH
jgi:hypothetical protein